MGYLKMYAEDLQNTPGCSPGFQQKFYQGRRKSTRLILNSMPGRPMNFENLTIYECTYYVWYIWQETYCIKFWKQVHWGNLYMSCLSPVKTIYVIDNSPNIRLFIADKQWCHCTCWLCLFFTSDLDRRGCLLPQPVLRLPFRRHLRICRLHVVVPMLVWRNATWLQESFSWLFHLNGITQFPIPTKQYNLCVPLRNA